MNDPKTLTTGTYVVDAPCPRCGVIEEILVSLRSVLRGKARDHDCKQARLVVVPREGES